MLNPLIMRRLVKVYLKLTMKYRLFSQIDGNGVDLVAFVRQFSMD